MSDELKKIYLAQNGSEAHAVCGRLCDEGIDAHVVGDSLESLHGNLGFSAAAEIWVPASQSEQARNCLRQWQLIEEA